MKKILTIIGSPSKTSINKLLSDCSSNFLKNRSDNMEFESLWLKDVNLPIFSVDLELAGYPNELKEILDKIKSADGVIFASPENNSTITVALKNLLDWLSRIDMTYLDSKKVLILGTSTGRGGAGKSTEFLSKLVGFGKGELISTFNLPSFNRTFDRDTLDFINEEDKNRFEITMNKFNDSF